jgi:hypothetical protein
LDVRDRSRLREVRAARRWTRVLGFQWHANVFTSQRSDAWARRVAARALIVPYWAILFVSSVAPAVWVMKWRVRQRRLNSSLCAVCGYDLRATPDRCPECGAQATTGATAAA